MTELKSPPRVWLVWVVIILVLAAWGMNYLILHDMDPNERGTYGDMFGAVNSIFSGFAFAGVVYAIVLQRHEVSIAKTELDRTKTLLEEQQSLAIRQEAEARKVSFENTFFQMLRLFSEIVARIDVNRTRSHLVLTGTDAFPEFLRVIQTSMSHNRSLGAKEAYEDFYSQHNSDLGHYFRTLYNLIKFVHHADVENKRLYTNLVRAQLSDPEVEILALNGASARGIKFKPLIEEYALLKNANPESRLMQEILSEYHDRSGIRTSD